jgi:hypothetical protein
LDVDAGYLFYPLSKKNKKNHAPNGSMQRAARMQRQQKIHKPMQNM